MGTRTVTRARPRRRGRARGLGSARDIAMTRILIGAIKQDGQPALRLPVGTVAGWQVRDEIAVIKTLRKRRRRFKVTRSFWRR